MLKEEKKNLTAKQKKIIKISLNISLILVLVAVWFYIVKTGIEYGKSYIDEAIVNIEIKNEDNYQNLMTENNVLNREIKRLNEELEEMNQKILGLNDSIDVFSLDVNALKSSIEFIDSSVNNSIIIQSEIGNKIQELDNRLKELKNSLNILLEAPQ